MKNGTRIPDDTIRGQVFADERGSDIGVNKSGSGEKLNIQAVVFQKRPASREPGSAQACPAERRQHHSSGMRVRSESALE
jgi:hypothetical protein